nr:pentatricopeptide repeat protein AaPPR566 [Agave angustifolia]
MKQNSCKPNKVSYNALIDAYGSVGMLAEAVEVLRGMESDGTQPDVVSISTLLAACGRCGQIVKIDSILLAAKCRGIELNVVAYNSAIGSYINFGEFDKALVLYRSMRENNVRPDSVTFNILISGSCKMGKYGECLEFFDEMTAMKVPLSNEVCSSLISAYSRQGQLVKAETIFTTMKQTGCACDVISYSTMMHAYSTTGDWQKAWEVFKDMEANDIQPDPIAFSSLMEALNRGCQPTRVLELSELMREKNIPFNSRASFEILSASSMLRDWRKASDIVEHMDPSFSLISVGLLNQLLYFLGKSGKIENMIKLFYKIVASGEKISFTTYSILLKNLLGAGKWRKYIEVLQWMEDAGTRPSLQMYHDVLSYTWRDKSTEYAVQIQERISMEIHFLYMKL